MNTSREASVLASLVAATRATTCALALAGAALLVAGCTGPTDGARDASQPGADAARPATATAPVGHAATGTPAHAAGHAPDDGDAHVPGAAHASGDAHAADDAHIAGDEQHAAELLSRLVAARGVSGREAPVRDVVIAELQRIDPHWQTRIDDAGNVWLQLGGERAAGASAASAAAPVVFIAHMDEIGLRVTSARADGLLECKSLGGFHDHLYRGTAIELVTASGKVLPGIALPASGGSPTVVAGAVTSTEPFVIDVGAHGAADLSALGVAVGDTATVPKELRRLGAHRVAGRSNDDRVGCASLLMALEELSASHGAAQLPRPAIFIWSTREEVGLEGADAAARAMRPVPSVVYAVDTFVTSDSPREDPHYADAPLGGGAVLRALDNSSQTPPSALAAVRAVAARHDITLQLGTMGGGNDGSRFVPEGAIDCPLAWPQRNSHSRVETLDLRDLLGLSRLIAALAREG